MFLNKQLIITILIVALSGCALTPEAKEAKYLTRGQKSFDRKDFSRAAIDFKNAARQMPKHPDAYYRLGITYLEVGDIQTGITFLQQALKVDPNYVSAKIKLAELMAMNSNSDVVREAERLSREALSLAKDNADAMATLALAELRLGSAAEAEANLRQTLARLPQHFKSSTVLATELLTKGDLTGAEQVMKEAAIHNPRSALPELALARIAAMRNSPEEVETHVRRAVQIDPSSEEGLLDLGFILVRVGKKDEAAKTFQTLQALPKTEHKSIYALYLLNTGQVDAGIRELERLYRKTTSDRELRTQLIAAYFSYGKVQQGEQVLTEALKNNSKDTEALIQRSQIEIRRGAYANAEKDLNQVLSFEPDSARVHYLLARLQASRGNALNEKHELNQALTLDATLLPARIDLSRALMRSGAGAAALELMDKAPQQQRHTLPAVVQRNWVLLSLHQMAELRKGIDEGYSLARTPDLLIQEAIYLAQMKDLARARTVAQEALSKAPNDTRALDLLIQIMNGQNDSASALSTVRALSKTQAKSAPVQLYLGMYLMRTGHKDEARVAFAQAKAVDPEFTAADFSAAQVDLMDGKLDSARKTLEKVIAKGANNENARVLMGMLEEQAGKYDIAISQFRKVLDTQPDNVTALNNLAFRLANNLNRADEALPYAEKAKELAPHNAAVEDSIGWVFYQKGLYATALRYLDDSVSKEPTAIREYHLAMVYAKIGNKKKATMAYQAGLRMNPSLLEANTARELLGTLR